jgi:NADP-dependent 3-hydroxy acid dehydrogenase YdfG
MAYKTNNILNKDSIVLISGGAKGITAECSIEIAKTTKCSLILIGRSILLENEPEWAYGKITEEDLKSSALSYIKSNSQKITPKELQKEINNVLSSREIQSTLQKVFDAGAKALYISADVTDRKSIQSAIKIGFDKFGEITGIIHGAGNLADKKIENKKGSDFDLVVNTKVKGLKNIAQGINSKALRFLVLFSSVAGFYGNAGQTDYAIANEILNKSAHIIQKSLPNCRVLSINWGPWDSGMVSPRLKKFFETKNIQLISSEFGVKTLIEALTENNSNPQIVVGAQMGLPSNLGGDRTNTILIQREIAHKDNPFLDDHRLGQQAVLPATCASAWIADTCQQLHPGYFFTKMEDFKILKGLTFNNDSHTYDIKLEPLIISTENEKAYDVQILSKGKNDRVVYHYSGRITLSSKHPHSPMGKPINQMGLDKSYFQTGLDLYTDGTFFHGPSFQGIQKVLDISEKRIITEISLPDMDDRAQGQFTVRTTNPYINDAVVQSLLLWTQRFYDSPCLPSRLHRWDNYKVPPFDQSLHAILNVTYHNENAVVGDLRVQTEEGNIFYIFTGLEGTVSKHLKRFFKKNIKASS